MRWLQSALTAINILTIAAATYYLGAMENRIMQAEKKLETVETLATFNIALCASQKIDVACQKTLRN